MGNIRESRLKAGTLTIAGIARATQATNVTLDPSTDEVGDPLEVLSGDEIGSDDETTWTLKITSVQDFDDPQGFQAFALLNAGDEVPFSWQPNTTGPSFAGTVKVRPLAIGGDVNSRLTVDVEWPCVGDPIPSWPTVTPPAGGEAAFGAGVYGSGTFGA